MNVMRKKININKIKKKYLDHEQAEFNDTLNANMTSREKVIFAFKTFGLVLLLLFGPSFFVLIFGNNYSNFSLTTKSIISFVANIFMLLFLFYLYRDTLLKDFKNFFNRNIFNNLEISFKYWLTGFLVMIVSNLIITVINNGGIAANEEGIRELIDLVPLYMIFDVAIYAPFTEELIFRKSIRDFTSTKLGYILTSGIIFGALHVVMSISNFTDLLYLIPYCSLGIAFAALYHKTNNIYSSISMHMLHNTMAIVLYLI